MGFSLLTQQIPSHVNLVVFPPSLVPRPSRAPARGWGLVTRLVPPPPRPLGRLCRRGRLRAIAKISTHLRTCWEFDSSAGRTDKGLLRGELHLSRNAK